MGESVKISLRIPQDLLTWIEGEVARKREKGLRTSTTDEIVTCIVHRFVSRMPAGKRRNLLKAMGEAPEPAEARESGEKIEQQELADVVTAGA